MENTDVSIVHINDLPSMFDADTYLEAYKLIDRVYAQAGKDIYSRDESFRLCAYAALIDHACNAVLDDGGPAVALWLLKRTRDWVRGEPKSTLSFAGRFLTETERDDLVKESEALAAERKDA